MNNAELEDPTKISEGGTAVVTWSSLFRKKKPELSPATKSLIEDRPDAWEYRLFSKVLADKIAAQKSLLDDYESGVSRGRRKNLKNPSFFTKWLDMQLWKAERFGPKIDELINKKLPGALGPPGSPGDADAIVDIAIKVGKIYREAIEWALTIRRVSAEPRFQNLLRLSERLVEDMIRQIREFSNNLETSLQAAMADDSPGQKNIELTLKVSIPPAVMKDMEKEMKALNT